MPAVGQAPVQAPPQQEPSDRGRAPEQPGPGAGLGNGDVAALLAGFQISALHGALIDYLDTEMDFERSLLLEGGRYQDGGADPEHPEHQGVLAILDRDHDGDVDEDDAVLLWAEEGSAPEEAGLGDSLTRFEQQIDREVGSYGPDMWRFGRTDRMEEMVATMGEAALTLRVDSKMAPTSLEEWYGPGERFDEAQFARGHTQGDLAREMSRPYLQTDITVEPGGLAAAIEQASRFAYAITVAVDECSTENTPLVQSALVAHRGRVARITVRGVEVSYEEFEQIYQRFAWEANHAYARDPRTGLTYDTSSPEGRLARDRHAQGEPAPIDHSNPLVESGGTRGLDSTMGLMSPDQIASARDYIREHPDDPTALSRLGHQESAEREAVSSSDRRFDGKTVPEVASLVFGEAEQLLAIADRAILEQGALLRAASRHLCTILDAEVRHDTFEALAGQLTYLREEIERETGTCITPYGLTAEAAQKHAVARLGDVRALDGDFVAIAGGILDALVPEVGDKGKLQLNANVPVGGGVGKIGMGIAAEVERDANGIKMRLLLEGKIIGTVDLKLAEAFIEARLFGYMESYGDHGAEVFHLLMLGIESRARQISDDLADVLFEPGFTWDVRDGMDRDDYVDSGLGASLTAGVTDSVGGEPKTDSMGQTVTTGTRLQRGSGDEPFERLDTRTVSFAATFNVHEFEVSGKLSKKLVNGKLSQLEFELAGKHDCPIDELSGLLQDAQLASGIVSELVSLAEGHSGLLGDDAARGLSSLAELGALASGRPLATANQLRDLAHGRRGFEGVKVGHQLTVKATWTPSARWRLEICLERLATIQFGKNPRERVYVALENIDPVFTFGLP